MRVVFLGTGDIGIPALVALVERGAYEIPAVYTQPDRPAGRDLKLRPSPIKERAIALGLPVFQPEKIRAAEELARLAELKPDVIVVAAYGQILPRSILELPKYGCLNIHASLLPRHRGASPVHAAVLAGDRESGITVMQMDVGLDTGDILLVETTEIGSRETAGSLHERLARMAPGALLKTLDLVAEGNLAPQKQDNALATYAPKLSRKDGEIDWTKTAAEIDRKIRGLTPWPGAYAFLPGNILLKVHAASPVADRQGEPGIVLDLADGILVGAGEGSVRLEEVQAAGGKRLAAREFLRGRHLQVGELLPASQA